MGKHKLNLKRQALKGNDSWNSKQGQVAIVEKRYNTARTGPLEEQITALLIECKRRGCMPSNKDLRTFKQLKSVRAYKNYGSEFVERQLRKLNARLDKAVSSKNQRETACKTLEHAEQRRKAQKQRQLKALKADMATLQRKLKSLKELRIEALKLNKRDLIRRVDETIAEKNGKYHEKLMMVLYDYDDISR